MCFPTGRRRGWRGGAGQAADFPATFSAAVLDLSAYVSNPRVSLVRAVLREYRDYYKRQERLMRQHVGTEEEVA